MVAVVFRSNSTLLSSQTKAGPAGVLFLFHFASSFAGFIFAFGAFLLSTASMIHKLRTLLPRGTSTGEAIQKNDTGKQRKQTKRSAV